MIARVVSPLWMFDVDGPITDPASRSIDDAGLLDRIIAITQVGGRVIFNTGRSVGWVMDNVIEPLQRRSTAVGHDATAVTDHCLVVGEKGATQIAFSAGAAHFESDPTLSVDTAVARAIRELVAGHFSDAMFVDTSKQSMLSVEMAHGMRIGDYQPRQAAFALAAQACVDRSGVPGMRVDVTTIAVDIESVGVGKALGADRALTWLEQCGVEVGSAVCFGDSGSDVAMADRLFERLNPGTPLTYINVGAPGALDRLGELRYTVVHALRDARGGREPAFGRGTALAVDRELA